MKGSITKLCAFLVRDAFGLTEHETVTLSASPDAVRTMAMRAKDERDALYATVRDLFSICDRLMGDTYLPDDDSQEMRAMQRAAKIIGHRGGGFIPGIDPHEQ